MIAKHRMLLEMHDLRLTLLEGRMDFLSQKYSARLQELLRQQYGRVPEVERRAIQQQAPEAMGDKIIAFLAGFDPDRAKKNTQWIIEVLLRGGMQWEDAESLTEIITRFTALKPHLQPAQRDIMRYKTRAELVDAIEAATPQDANLPVSQRQMDKALDVEMRKEAKILMDTPEYRILVPLTLKASCYFGVNTRWCTTSPDNRFFNQYTRQGPLYIILDKKNNRRWQFHFETQQFMDEQDHQIDLGKFEQEHPAVAAFFHSQEETIEQIGRMAQYYLFKTERGIDVRQSAMGGLRRSPPVGHLGIVDNELLSVDLDNLRGHSSEHFPLNADFNLGDLPKVLTELGVEIDGDQVLCDFGLFYNNGKWGNLAEVGEKIVDVDMLTGWYAVGDNVGDDENGDTYLALVEAGKILWEVLIDDEHNITAEIPRAMKYEACSHYIKTLLLNVEGDEFKWADESRSSYYYYKASELTDADAAEFVEKKPSLAPLKAFYDVKGEQDAGLRARVLSDLQEFFDKAEYADDHNIVVARFKNVADFIEDHGNDTAKNTLNWLESNEHYDSDGSTADSSDVFKLLRTLSPEVLAKVGAYMQNNYADEIEENFESFDPTSAKDISDLHDEVSDESLQSAANFAMADGYRAGAESDAYKTLYDEADKHILYLIDGKWTDKRSLDAPVAVFASIKEVVEVLTDADRLYELKNGEDWCHVMEIEVDVSEPSYGWSGYDADVAKEAFDNQVYEFI